MFLPWAHNVDNSGKQQQDCKQNRNRLINDAYCCQVMPGRKLHLSVLKGACRCEPWIENGAGKKKKKKGGGMFMLLLASPLPALSPSPSLSSPSFSLTRSLSRALLQYMLIHTEEHTHLLFRLSPSRSQPLFLFSAALQRASPFPSLASTKGSVISGARSF